MTGEVTKENVIRERIRTGAPNLRNGSELLEIRTEMVLKDFQVVYMVLVELDLKDVCCVVINPVEELVGGHEILIANVSNPPSPRFQPAVGAVEE